MSHCCVILVASRCVCFKEIVNSNSKLGEQGQKVSLLDELFPSGVQESEN